MLTILHGQLSLEFLNTIKKGLKAPFRFTVLAHLRVVLLQAEDLQFLLSEE